MSMVTNTLESGNKTENMVTVYMNTKTPERDMKDNGETE